MRAKGIFLLAALFAAVASANAQGVIAPPVSSFNPDTSLPSVNVPEFVITGKAQIELPKADKPTVEIDSSYFRDKNLQGVQLDIPLNRDISSQALRAPGHETSLFARASIGHYSTARYLLSGGTGIGGFDIDGSLSGDYTSGFVPNTMRRDFSIQAGVHRDMNSEELIKSSNSMDLGYSRSSYSLYGGPLPVLQRSTEGIRFGINSDMYLSELPLAFGLEFNRFSLNDYWHNTQSYLKLHASTQVQLSSGWLGFDGGFLFGNHTLSSQAPGGSPVTQAASINRSIYDLRLGGSYGNTFLQGAFSYSLGLVYYQYRDDSANTVAKLYPDVRANYLLNDDVSLFASFDGSVRNADIAGFVSSDRFVNGSFPLLNTQYNADFLLGSRLVFWGGLVVTPEIRLRSAKYYPVFFSVPTNESLLSYAGKATITSFRLTGQYSAGGFSSELALQYQKGTADSLSSIPNLPPFDANLRLTYDITPEFAARAEFLFLSSRYSDLALAGKLDPVSLLNIRFSYRFNISKLPFEVFAGGENILNEKYFIWQGYQEFPLTLYIGFSSGIL